MEIGFDCDDVLAEFEGTFVKAYNKKYNASLNKGDLTPSYMVWEDKFGTKKADDLLKLITPEFTTNLEVVEGAVEGVKELYDLGAKLYIITNRFIDAEQVTEDYIETHFPGMFKEIRYASNHGLKGRKNKGEICKELGITHFTDDHTDNIVKTNEHGVTSLLYDCPWNKEFKEHGLIERVHNWPEVIARIKRDF
jgi:5'(3')-deoxyribonucleotidase